MWNLHCGYNSILRWRASMPLRPFGFPALPHYSNISFLFRNASVQSCYFIFPALKKTEKKAGFIRLGIKVAVPTKHPFMKSCNGKTKYNRRDSRLWSDFSLFRKCDNEKNRYLSSCSGQGYIRRYEFLFPINRFEQSVEKMNFVELEIVSLTWGLFQMYLLIPRAKWGFEVNMITVSGLCS